MKQVTVTYAATYLLKDSEMSLREPERRMRGYLHGPTKAKPSALIIEDQAGHVHVVASSITKEGWE